MTKKILCVKDPLESRYRLPRKKKIIGIKKIKNPNVFIDYSQTIDNIYEDLEDYNPTKKWKVFDMV